MEKRKKNCNHYCNNQYRRVFEWKKTYKHLCVEGFYD